MLPTNFSLPKELQWLETVGTSSMLEGEVLADKIADIHSTHYSSEAMTSARRLWTRVGARATHMGDKYKELLDAIYIKHTIVTTSLICYYCKRSNPRDLTCQDLERFFQTVSDVLSMPITDEMLPISDSHIRLLLQHLLSNDETRLAFFDFIFECNTHEEGITQVTFDNACRVLLVFFSKHKLLSSLLEYIKNSDTTTISKYLWPMLFNFLSTYSSAGAISDNYNFDSSIYPLIIDKFCRQIISSSRADGIANIVQRSEPLDMLNRTDATRQCLEDIDSVLFHQQDSASNDSALRPETLIRTPNTTKRVQFAGIRDDSFLEHPSPQKINVAPSYTKADTSFRVATPITQAKRDRPPSALSQKQTELAARLAAFKASSQRRLSASGASNSVKQLTSSEKDISNLASPHSVNQQAHLPYSEHNRQQISQSSRPASHDSLYTSSTSNKTISNNMGISDINLKSDKDASQDRLTRSRLLAENPYNYIAPVARIILEARKAIAARQSTRENNNLNQHTRDPITETIQLPGGACVATPSISSQGCSTDRFSQAPKLSASAMTTPSVTEQAFNSAVHTPLQRQRQTRPLVSDVAAKYASRRNSFKPDCITLQPAQHQTIQNTAIPTTSLTPSIGASSAHGAGATTGMRQLSATAAKYINLQASHAGTTDQIN